MKKLIFVLLGLGIIVLIGAGCSETTSSTIDLNASVRFTGTQFIITNEDNFDWTNVKLEVNDIYILRTEIMVAGETYTVGAMQFAKKDGTKLNPFTTKSLNFSIWCNTPNGKGWWYGGWE